jgi:Mg-chelatase subunit ChlD
VTSDCCGGSRKKITDLEGKLRVAVQEKTNAVQDKANLERQLKQQASRVQILEKNLEKKDVQADRRRESMMVVSLVTAAGSMDACR